MDFATNRLQTGQGFRVLTKVNQCNRECSILDPDIHLTRNRVVTSLNEISKHRPMTKSITLGNGSEFAGKALIVGHIKIELSSVLYVSVRLGT